jgi:hypothetical protein
MIMNMNTQNISELNQNAQPNFSDRCMASCKKILAQLDNVKAQVVAEFRDRLEDHQHVLELAVNEAEALAWQAGFPQLLFPMLATEKASAVTGWHLQQQSLRRRNTPVLVKM